MAQDIFYSLPIFKVLYRFLKTYDIPISADKLTYGFDSHKHMMLVDAMCVNYLNNSSLNLQAKDTRLVNILDYFWCSFLVENYDSISKLVADYPNFRLKTKAELQYILQWVGGVNLLKHMPNDIKNELKLNIHFEFDFSHEKDK